MAALLFIALAASGILLRFIYVPSAEQAYTSILHFQEHIIFGRLLRNIHHWSGQFLVVISFLHLSRVFYSQSIYNCRKVNWLYGLLLFGLVIASSFTGYLLPWDQRAYWAVTIMTSLLSYIPVIGDVLASLIRGGSEVCENTLVRFYHLHTGLLPPVMLFFMCIHFWLVRKAKGIAVPGNKSRSMIPSNPNLVCREIFAALILSLCIMAVSMVVDAPLLGMADPAQSPNPCKTLWYFMGFQELLINVHPLYGAFIIPALVLGLLISIPFFNNRGIHIGTWFNSPKGKTYTLYSFVYSLLFTFGLIIFISCLRNLQKPVGYLPFFITQGLFPLLLYILPTAFFLFVMNRILKTGRAEMLIGLITVLITSYATMTFTGLFLRGQNMQLFNWT